MRYLKSPMDFCIIYRVVDLQSHSLQAWTNLDWASDYDTHCLTSGLYVQLTQCLVWWNLKKQRSITLSSTKVEYIALTHVTKEVLWLRHLRNEIGFSQLQPTVIYCDNQSCLALTKNSRFHNCPKHIEIRYNFIGQKGEGKEIIFQYTPMTTMWGDIFTKA